MKMMRKFFYGKKIVDLKNCVKPLIAIVALGLPAITLAAGDSTSLTDVLQSFLDLLTNTWGKLIATLAIVGVGLGCFVFGKLSKSWVIAVVLGIGIVFGANGILKSLGV